MNEFYIIVTPMVMVCLDLVSGSLAAMHRGEMNSSVMFEGMFKKLSEVLAIVVAKATELAIAVFGAAELGMSPRIPVCMAICIFITMYELVSVVENIGKMNPAIGGALVRILGIDPSKVGLDEGDVQ